MKWTNFLFGVLVGGIAAHIWHRKDWKKKNSSEAKMSEVTADVIQEESNKFSGVLKKQYDIVMPSDQISKKVRQKANELTAGRNTVRRDRVKPPVSI